MILKTTKILSLNIILTKILFGIEFGIKSFRQFFHSGFDKKSFKEKSNSENFDVFKLKNFGKKIHINFKMKRVVNKKRNLFIVDWMLHGRNVTAGFDVEDEKSLVFINYSKLCKDTNGGELTLDGAVELASEYIGDAIMLNQPGFVYPTVGKLDVTNLFNQGILFELDDAGQDNGIYGPRYLFEIMLMVLDPTYADYALEIIKNMLDNQK